LLATRVVAQAAVVLFVVVVVAHIVYVLLAPLIPALAVAAYVFLQRR